MQEKQEQKNLGGKIEQSSDEEVQEESVGELLPGESNDVDKTLPENVQTHLPGEGQPVHDEGGSEPVEVPAEEINQKKTKKIAKLKKTYDGMVKGK